MKRMIFRLALPLMLLAAIVSASCSKDGGKLMVNSKVEVTEDAAEIVFDSLSHNYGDILPDTTASYDFVFHNIGATPLKLDKVVPGCGCTKTSWPHGTIDPGDAGVITAVYDSHGRGTGHFNKSIRVYSNAKTGFLRLSICGNIVEAQP